MFDLFDVIIAVEYIHHVVFLYCMPKWSKFKLDTKTIFLKYAAADERQPLAKQLPPLVSIGGVSALKKLCFHVPFGLWRKVITFIASHAAFGKVN